MTPQKPKMPKPKLMPDKPKMPVKKQKQKPKDREALPMVSHNGVILFALQGKEYAGKYKN